MADRTLPVLYDLFWREPGLASRQPVAQQHKAVLREPTLVSAIILYPAFLTPEVVRLEGQEAGENDWFEVLLATVDMAPEQLVPRVNQQLQVQLGLDPERLVSHVPLFDDPSKGISVKKLDYTFMIKTEGGFRGILHPKFRLPDILRHFYQVRIKSSCLARAAARPTAKDGAQPTGKTTVIRDLQDRLLHRTLVKMNGPALKGDGGWGTHCFKVSNGSVDLTAVDHEQPVRAYHPLFVYKQGEIGHATLGHASDLHLNARQAVLQRSDARVIDAHEGEEGERVSPRIGGMVNVYASNFSTILKNLDAAGADVVLLGGDLVDHHHNCFPFATTGAPAAGDRGNPAKVWGLLDLDDDGNYTRHYQAFVDLLSFYSIVRNHCHTSKVPVFVVAGNHDAYEHAYGIAPRVWGLKRANEGIPADHNLTMYEAILAFGESFGKIRQNFNFKAELFGWFFNVLTPFSDYAVELPEQRIVGLHWGEAEEMISAPFTGHGIGHLPRADEAGTPAQVSLLQDGFREKKPTVLFSHFTFVSYVESIAVASGPVWGETGYGSVFFGDHDMGTFEQQRAPLYRLAADHAKMQAVFTGHSHRKGLYLLRPNGSGMATEGYPIPMDKNITTGHGRVGPGDATPIIVSDCAGPIPRLNLYGEFESWGSDRPSGTLARVSKGGRVSEVLAVGADGNQAAPRIAVALEYLQVLEGSGAVFGSIMTSRFRPLYRYDEPHAVRLKLGKVFKRVSALSLTGLVLWCKATVDGKWGSLTLKVEKVEEGLLFVDQIAVAHVPKGQENAKAFLRWLTAPGAGRFMSLTFKVDPRAELGKTKKLGRTGWDDLKHYNETSPWLFEVECVPCPDGGYLSFGIIPRFEAPNFDWRRQLAKYRAS
jgi:hypothetical protein